MQLHLPLFPALWVPPAKDRRLSRANTQQQTEGHTLNTLIFKRGVSPHVTTVNDNRFRLKNKSNLVIPAAASEHRLQFISRTGPSLPFLGDVQFIQSLKTKRLIGIQCLGDQVKVDTVYYFNQSKAFIKSLP